jgi:peptidoglycan/LPS O-acetylase OafA/YrhL
MSLTSRSEPRAVDLSAGVPALDGVRGAAALLVVLTHVAFQTGEVLRGAHGAVLARFDFGVALFFVLSGLLLYRPWAAADLGTGRAPSTRRYLRRRAVRILPAYWLVVVVALATGARAVADPATAARHLTLTQVYAGRLLPDLTQTWSLCTEVAFYLLLPVAAAVLARCGSRARLALLAGTVLVAWTWTGLSAGGVLPARAGTWLPGHADWFAGGMLLAALVEQARADSASWAGRLEADLRSAPGTLLALAAGLGALACTPLAGPRTLAAVAPGGAVAKEALYLAVAVLVVGAALVAGPRTAVSRLLGSPPAQWCGRVSYGVFLWHLLVLDAAMRILGVPLFGGRFWLVATVTVAGSLLVAAGSWYAYERPLLHRFSRPVSGHRDEPRAGDGSQDGDSQRALDPATG